MDDWPRYRIVSSISRIQLTREVRDLKKHGWATLGEAALAVAARPGAPPYWVQTLYRAKAALPTVIVSKPPAKATGGKPKSRSPAPNGR